jgi:MFS family permease
MAMTLYEPAFNVLTKRFPDRYLRGITALTLVGGFASTLSFPAVAGLVARFDWRGALAAIGALLLLAVAPLHAWALRGAPEHSAAVAIHDAADDATLYDALREPSFWLLTATFTLYSFAAAALWAHLMPAFIAKGCSEAQALAVVVWFGPAQVAGRLAYVGFGRWIASRTLGLLVLGGLPVSLAIFALADGTEALLVFALLFGLANGLVTIVRGSLVPEYFGREHVGRISGAMNGISLFARAAAPLATAWLLLAVPGYREMLLVLAATGVAAVVAFAFAKPPGR